MNAGITYPNGGGSFGELSPVCQSDPFSPEFLAVYCKVRGVSLVLPYPPESAWAAQGRGVGSFGPLFAWAPSVDPRNTPADLPGAAQGFTMWDWSECNDNL